MTTSSFAGEHRRGPALSSRARAFGLTRRSVTTSLGLIVVRASPRMGDTATIFLHGAAGSWTTWTPLLRAADEFGSPLSDVIALDLPGWGESPAAASSTGVVELSRAIVEVARALGYERWTIVGHSLGGLLALDIAAREPARTNAVLLISPSGPAVLAGIRHPVGGGRALPWFGGMLFTMRALAALGRAGTALVRGLHRVGRLRGLSAPLFDDPARVHGSVIDALATEVRPRAFADAARAAARYDESIWRAITCPVRSVCGERDVFVSDADAAELDRQIPDFASRTVAGAGHFAAVEQPESVLRSLTALSSAVAFSRG